MNPKVLFGGVIAALSVLILVVTLSKTSTTHVVTQPIIVQPAFEVDEVVYVQPVQYVIPFAQRVVLARSNFRTCVAIYGSSKVIVNQCEDACEVHYGDAACDVVEEEHKREMKDAKRRDQYLASLRASDMEREQYEESLQKRRTEVRLLREKNKTASAQRDAAVSKSKELATEVENSKLKKELQVAKNDATKVALQKKQLERQVAKTFVVETDSKVVAQSKVKKPDNKDKIAKLSSELSKANRDLKTAQKILKSSQARQNKSPSTANKNLVGKANSKVKAAKGRVASLKRDIKRIAKA